jgi:DNA-binding MarR family transcriptional regulator
MAVNSESGNLVLRLWLLMHRTEALLKMCEDKVFGEHKLTTEQLSVLMTIKYFGDPVRPSDVAGWLVRSTNSVSMIVDRMVKAGLVRRIRDKRDRRAVHLFITSKGEELLKPATIAGWNSIKGIMSTLSYEEMLTLHSLLEKIKYKATACLNPESDVEEMIRNETERYAALIERLIQYTLPSTPEAKRQSGKKKKAIC